MRPVICHTESIMGDLDKAWYFNSDHETICAQVVQSANVKTQGNSLSILLD